MNWIKTNEELPREEDSIQIVNIGGRVCLEVQRPTLIALEDGSVSTGCYNHEEKCWVDTDDDEIPAPLYWLKYPNPPEPKE